MMPQLSRRALLGGAGTLAAALSTGAANARILPKDMDPLIGPGYRAVDQDEKGLWQLMERVEEEVSGSNLMIQDDGLKRYLGDLIGNVGGPAARDMRIYLARIPEFNAMMFPTGFTVVFSGLLLRMRNEAQLAGVIAHESAHFLRKHQIRQWRDMRRKTDIFSFLAMGAGVAGGAAGIYAGDLIQLAQFGTILSLLKYNRTLEAEADAMGVRLLAEAGYDPMAMSETWEQLIGELDLSAKYRRKRRDRDFSLFSTHPSPDSRMADLKISAAEVRQPGKTYDAYRERYLGALKELRPTLLDDQVKLNDPGASQYIIDTLAKDGWNGLLRFHEGEIWRLRNSQSKGDETRAAQGYAAAVMYPDAPPDAWRWHGVMLMKQGRAGEARAAFTRYLQMSPNAPDAALVRQMVAG
ncbi:M48 family metalloprotease [Sphingomonas sp. NSE70-1]|uniref:M48 family metalloprotease n=1 Tax=Sphingomonas caseinilyticus TaxID=2908205 RepID=A0ABT0RQX0_9SPHN|nr:M48 family metalloprotease [Sphingomonas caseinilyticus]MCL6697412.1 M48 family metalloprotease [Sphingomonas caseinilyticus]